MFLNRAKQRRRAGHRAASSRKGEGGRGENTIGLSGLPLCLAHA